VGGESEALAGLAFSGTRFFGGEADRDLLLDTPPLGQDAPQLVHHLAQFYLWLEEFPRARAQVAALSGAAWAASSPSLLAPALSTRSAVLTVYGEWPAAYADACESLRLFEDTGQAAHYPLARAAAIEALRGDEAACTASAERGLFVAEKLGIGSARCYAQAALAQLALGLGRWEEAIGRLLELKTLLYEWGIRHPAVVEWQPDLIEAYVRTGATERAHEELSALELVASRAGNASARAAALRCRGLLAEGDTVDALFLSSLDEQEQLPRPFERARTELCYGERLRRARRKSDARHHLELALRTFEELGARPWAGRARSELQALGIRVPRRASATELELTPQELRVALAVREGATNREASAALFLSPKTIEAHLSSIYRKLGVRSRTELATLLARNETQSADHVLR
jgi:DNA-binding CsgD family transcriptional regulator